jgi:hypothetical protein
MLFEFHFALLLVCAGDSEVDCNTYHMELLHTEGARGYRSLIYCGTELNVKVLPVVLKKLKLSA